MARDFVVLRHVAVNFLHLDPAQRKATIDVRRLITAAYEEHRIQVIALL